MRERARIAQLEDGDPQVDQQGIPQEGGGFRSLTSAVHWILPPKEAGRTFRATGRRKECAEAKKCQRTRAIRVQACSGLSRSSPVLR